jgi:putative transposase
MMVICAKRWKAVASERRRFSYRRIHVMLQRRGIVMNLKKLRWLYGEERLQVVRKRCGRKRALGTRRPMIVPDRPNQRWSLDFVSGAFTDGRRYPRARPREGRQHPELEGVALD